MRILLPQNMDRFHYFEWMMFEPAFPEQAVDSEDAHQNTSVRETVPPEVRSLPPFYTGTRLPTLFTIPERRRIESENPFAVWINGVSNVLPLHLADLNIMQSLDFEDDVNPDPADTDSDVEEDPRPVGYATIQFYMNHSLYRQDNSLRFPISDTARIRIMLDDDDGNGHATTRTLYTGQVGSVAENTTARAYRWQFNTMDTMVLDDQAMARDDAEIAMRMAITDPQRDPET